MKALVTGGTGFIGSHLVEELLNKEYEVSCLIRKTSNLKWIKNQIKNPNLKLVYGNIKNKRSLDKMVEDRDIVFHLAGLTKSKNTGDYYQINSFGTKYLADACEKSNIKKFIYMSSQAVAGPSLERKIDETDKCRPITDYGQSKLKAEEEIMEHTFPWIILRPSPVYGPRDKDIHTFFKIVKMHIKPEFAGKERYVNLCYVKDLVNATILAAESDKSKETYFISDGNRYSWKIITDVMAETLGVKAIRVKIPILLAKAGAIISEYFVENSPFTRQKLKELCENWLCDISKARKELKYKAKTTLEEGIKLTANWYLTYKWL